jgi:hypothetical protein
MPIKLLEACEPWINSWLGRTGCREHYTTRTAANDVSKRNSTLSSGAALIGTLLQHFADRWRAANRKPSQENWRWKPVKEGGEGSVEVYLERQVVRYPAGDWVNAIPTASGTYDPKHGRCNIDLGFRDASRVTFFELKWASNNPLYAALELLAYACQWFLSKQFSVEMGYGSPSDESLRPALMATAVDWVVLAPAAYYKRLNFAGLQLALNEGLRETAQVRTPGVDMQFRFEQFTVPDGSNWKTDEDALRVMDAESLRTMIGNRCQVCWDRSGT